MYERVWAKRCDALDWDQIGMNLDQIGLTAHAGASKKKGSNLRKTQVLRPLAPTVL